MESEVEVRKAFTEAFVILTNLELYDRLPLEFKKVIESNMDVNHTFSFDKNIPLFNQVENNVTRNLITYIYVNYIDKDNKEFFQDELNNILNINND